MVTPLYVVPVFDEFARLTAIPTPRLTARCCSSGADPVGAGAAMSDHARACDRLSEIACPPRLGVSSAEAEGGTIRNYPEFCSGLLPRLFAHALKIRRAKRQPLSRRSC